MFFNIHHTWFARFFFVGLFIFMLLPGASVADKNDWKRLGTAEVKYRAEKDEIKVGAERGTFHAIKLEARGADLEIFRLLVTYSNGADEELDVRQRIKAGGQTRPLDLRGSDRSIRKVTLFYKTESGEDRKARVSLWGRK